ncbi:MAG: cytochrome c [Planctomycetales bacterium]|nr:cytochrome c [Planctomycetales bacterium]
MSFCLCQTIRCYLSFCLATTVLIGMVAGQDQSEHTLTEPAVSQVQARYQELCADCHGADARGTEYRQSGIAIPDLADHRWLAARNSTQLRLAILLGKGAEMPPFESEISRTEADQLVQYLYTLVGFKTDVQGSDVQNELKVRLMEFRTVWEELQTQWETEFRALAELQAAKNSFDAHDSAFTSTKFTFETRPEAISSASNFP